MRPYANEMTLRDYLRILFRQKSVVITAVITVLVIVLAGLNLKTPVYQSDVKILVTAEKQIDPPYYKGPLGNRSIEVALTQGEIVRSRPVIERSVKAVGLYQRPLDYEKNFCSLMKLPLVKIRTMALNSKLKKLPEEQKIAYLYRMAVEDLKLNIKVVPIRDTYMFIIRVSDFSPVGAAILANVVSRSYVIFDLEQQFAQLQMKYGIDHPTVMQLKDNIEKMVRSLNGQPLPDIEAIGPASVKIIEQASLPTSPTGISKQLTMLLAVFMSLFLGIMLAFVFEYFDQTFKSPADIETILGLTYLGAVPKQADINTYQNLAEQIYLLLKDNKLKTVLFSAAYANEGVTTNIFNLGSYLSKVAGHRVLIIDANFRNPSMHKLFKLADVCGLSDVLEDKAAFDKTIKDLGANLHLLVAGKTMLNPITLLGSHMMAEVMRQAKEKYDVVLIDCAELTDYKDSVVLSSDVDGVVLVVTEGQTRRQAVSAAIIPLKQIKVNLIGVILRNRSYVIPKIIYDRV